MDKLLYSSTYDNNYLLQPKQEQLDPLTNNDCHDYKYVIIPKKEPSNTDLYREYGMVSYDKNSDIVMPIKTERTLSNDIAHFRRQYESEQGSLTDRYVSMAHSIKVEPKSEEINEENCTPERDVSLLKESKQRERSVSPDKKEALSWKINDKPFKYRNDSDVTKTHTSETPCPYLFTVKFPQKTNKEHIRRRNLLFICDTCQRKFSVKAALIKHLRTHTGEKPFTCSVCRTRFSQKSSLNTHLKTHSSEKPYSCNLCRKTFARKCILNEHLLTHTGQKPFSCDICDRRFSRKSSLTDHRITHTGEKYFSCGVCQKRITRKSNLARHMLTHSDSSKHISCDLCTTKFTCKGNLTRHMKIHSGIRPYSCEYCQKKFIKKNNLDRHTVTHTRDKTVHCQVCQKMFTNRGHLTRHLRSHLDLTSIELIPGPPLSDSLSECPVSRHHGLTTERESPFNEKG